MPDATRRQIEQYKQAVSAEIDADAQKYVRALEREVAYLQRKYEIENLENLRVAVLREFRLPSFEVRAILDIMSKTESTIGPAWDAFWENKKVTWTAVRARATVDFLKLRADQREVLDTALDNAVKKGFDYTAFRQEFLRAGHGYGPAKTLTNTAIAQYDNAYMSEIAQQAGVERYIYDGPVNINTRIFCRRHAGQSYTMAELRAMDNGQGLPVETALGGYNCVHYLTPEVADYQINRLAIKA